ncbi:hypothetical protein T484DRAFT_2545602 [Baffinella frigidus]|nr:hypothetical protein T484DRAFT_2545602 [Cryptophyta sp. CCMP2293]
MHKIASSALLLALLGLTALLPVTESLISTPHAPLHLRVTAFSAARCAPSSWSQLGQSTLVGGRPAVLGLWQPRSRAAVVRAAADSDSSPSLESLGLPRDVREQVQGLSDDERNSLLAMVGLKAPFVPGTGGRKRERPRREPKPKETSSGRRQRRQVSEAKKKFEEAGGISPVVERRRGEKGADKTQVKDGAARAGVPSSPEPAQAKKGREDAVLQTAGQARAEWLEKDGEEEDEDFDEDDEDDEDEEDEEGGGLRSEEARFFGDALPSERTAKDKSFLDSIFGDSLGKEPAAWSDEEEDEDSEEGDEGADAAADGEDDDDDFSFLGPKRERAVMERLRLDALAGVGGARQGEAGAVRGQMEFPDVQTIDPYNPQTFGYTLVGAVLGAHGVRGEIKVTSQGMSDFAAERISRGWQLFLQMPGRRSPRPRRCVLARPGAKSPPNPSTLNPKSSTRTIKPSRVRAASHRPTPYTLIPNAYTINPEPSRVRAQNPPPQL